MKKIIVILMMLFISSVFAQDDFTIKTRINIVNVPVMGFHKIRYIYASPVFESYLGNRFIPFTRVFIDTAYVNEFNFFDGTRMHVTRSIATHNDDIKANSYSDFNFISPNPSYGSQIGTKGNPYGAIYTKKIWFTEFDGETLEGFDIVNVNLGGDNAYMSNGDLFNHPYKVNYDSIYANYQKTSILLDTITIIQGTNYAVGGFNISNQDARQIQLLPGGEIQTVDSINSALDTLWIFANWATANGTYMANWGFFILPIITQDSTKYHDRNYGNRPDELVKNFSYDNARYNNQTEVVAKTGGLWFRHDNFTNPRNDLMSLQTVLMILDKYRLKGTWGINSGQESNVVAYPWVYQFLQYMQKSGHEIADHSPDHDNFKYTVLPIHRKVTTDMPGIMSIDAGAVYDTVKVDTLDYPARNVQTVDGQSIMLKRADAMWRYMGLSKPTFHIDGGAQYSRTSPDSGYISGLRNGYIGGTNWYDYRYRHVGFNPPLDWREESPFNHGWVGEESTGLAGHANRGVRIGWAQDFIRRIVNTSARNAVTTFGYHAAGGLSDQWFIDCFDSILQFIALHPADIKVQTASEWMKTLYYSQTNPYENVFPHNFATNQVFEDDIDGDNFPDGWSFGELEWAITDDYGTYDNGGPANVIWGTGNNSHIFTGGSQGSRGCVTVKAADTLYMHRLFGLEKGLNYFAFDVKDSTGESSDSVHVKITVNYALIDSSIADQEQDSIWVVPVTSSWVTQEKEIIIPYNASYLRMWVWGDNSDAALVDEFILRRKN